MKSASLECGVRSSVRAPFVLLLALVAGTATLAFRQAVWLGGPRVIATGVEYFTSTDRTLIEPAGPIAVFLLKLDPRRARLDSALSNDEVMGAETVDALAARRHSLAAINGGFFNTKTGEPVSLLKVAGEIVSDTPATKGAVVIQSPSRGRTELWFDQLA